MQFYPVTYIASEIKSNPRFNYFVLYSDRALGFRLPFSDKTLRVRRMRRRLKKRMACSVPAPHSQSSARRADINIMFTEFFFFNHAKDFAEIFQGLLVVYSRSWVI